MCLLRSTVVTVISNVTVAHAQDKTMPGTIKSCSSNKVSCRLTNIDGVHVIEMHDFLYGDFKTLPK
tara:strand:+ start:723 stop:920 length:198 start_codon:yes stop_codon:yes gene_type:complete